MNVSDLSVTDHVVGFYLCSESMFFIVKKKTTEKTSSHKHEMRGVASVIPQRGISQRCVDCRM